MFLDQFLFKRTHTNTHTHAHQHTRAHIHTDSGEYSIAVFTKNATIINNWTANHTGPKYISNVLYDLLPWEYISRSILHTSSNWNYIKILLKLWHFDIFDKFTPKTC